jgi:hypothetical protein
MLIELNFTEGRGLFLIVQNEESDRLDLDVGKEILVDLVLTGRWFVLRTENLYHLEYDTYIWSQVNWDDIPYTLTPLDEYKIQKNINNVVISDPTTAAINISFEPDTPTDIIDLGAADYQVEVAPPTSKKSKKRRDRNLDVNRSVVTGPIDIGPLVVPRDGSSVMISPDKLTAPSEYRIVLPNIFNGVDNDCDDDSVFHRTALAIKTSNGLYYAIHVAGFGDSGTQEETEDGAPRSAGQLASLIQSNYDGWNGPDWDQYDLVTIYDCSNKAATTPTISAITSCVDSTKSFILSGTIGKTKLGDGTDTFKITLNGTDITPTITGTKWSADLTGLTANTEYTIVAIRSTNKKRPTVKFKTCEIVTEVPEPPPVPFEEPTLNPIDVCVDVDSIALSGTLDTTAKTFSIEFDGTPYAEPDVDIQNGKWYVNITSAGLSKGTTYTLKLLCDDLDPVIIQIPTCPDTVVEPQPTPQSPTIANVSKCFNTLTPTIMGTIGNVPLGTLPNDNFTVKIDDTEYTTPDITINNVSWVLKVPTDLVDGQEYKITATRGDKSTDATFDICITYSEPPNEYAPIDLGYINNPSYRITTYRTQFDRTIDQRIKENWLTTYWFHLVMADGETDFKIILPFGYDYTGESNVVINCSALGRFVRLKVKMTDHNIAMISRADPHGNLRIQGVILGFTKQPVMDTVAPFSYGLNNTPDIFTANYIPS